MKHDIKKMYNLPSDVKFCKKCVMSNQRPRITFDENGVCSACNYAEYKEKVNWGQREEELIALCNKHRKNNGEYDVVVPCSGGKDGGFVAHQLKYKYNMNPLCVTWSPLLPTDIGKENLANFIRIGGFDHIMGTPNGAILRKMTNLSFKELGDPFQPFIYGQTNFPLKIAVQNKISLIMYGENGEVEYGGNMETAYKPTREIKNHDKMYFSNLPPEFWLEYGITENDIYAYKAPKYEEIMKNKTEIHFLGYYKKWDPQENFYYCVENTGFKPNYERSEGTYSKYASLDDKIDGFHYYLGFIKFGIGRATSDAAHEIRDGKITRDEGIALVKKFDGEMPSKYYNEFLNFVGIDDNEFNEIIDSWRAEHIWTIKDGLWKLRNTIYGK